MVDEIHASTFLSSLSILSTFPHLKLFLFPEILTCPCPFSFLFKPHLYHHYINYSFLNLSSSTYILILVRCGLSALELCLSLPSLVGFTDGEIPDAMVNSLLVQWAYRFLARPFSSSLPTLLLIFLPSSRKGCKGNNLT